MAAMTEAQQAVFVLQQEYQTAKARTPEPNGTLRQLLTQSINLKTAVEYIPANKNQHKLDKEN